MKFEEAKGALSAALEEAKAKIQLEDVEVSTVISYQNNKGDDCGEDDANLRFLAGELFIKHNALTEDDKLGYCMVIDCKRKNAISEKHVKDEIDGFNDELDRMLTELNQAENPVLFISALSQIAEQQTAELEEKFKEQMAKIDRNVKTVNIITIVAAVVSVLSIILVQLLK